MFLSPADQRPGLGEQRIEFLGLARNVFPLPEGTITYWFSIPHFPQDFFYFLLSF
jgi:hypothetical protein